MHPYERLRNAIVKTACDDYKTALKKKNYAEIRSIERFFRSTYYSNICDIDPEYLIRKLREKYEVK